MKSGASAVKWRPVAGVVFAGALMVGVGAFAAPRAGDSSTRVVKGGSTVQSESVSLISGSGEHLQAVIAGNANGTKIELYPVPALIGSYPPGTTIADVNHDRPLPKGPNVPYNEIATDSGPLRIWSEWKYSGWDPNGNDIQDGTGVCTAGACTAGITGSCSVNADCDRPGAAVFQAFIVGAGMLDASTDGNGDTTDDGNQPDLIPAYVSCPSVNATGNAACATAFGVVTGALQSNVTCDVAINIPGCPFTNCCTPMWYNPNDTGRPDNACAGIVCNGTCSIAAPSIDWGCFASANSDIIHDDGTKKFGGYFVIDVPALAKGRYFIDLNKDSTFAGNRESPPVLMPLGEVSGMSVFIRTGSCCFALGTPGQGCTDGLLRSECGDDEPLPFVWTADKACSDGCVECINDAGCNETPTDDKCTIDTCNTTIGVCNHALVAGFDPLTECCNRSDASITTRDDGDVCTGDVCSEPNSRGVAQHPILPASTPCLDGNPCTTGDHCDGLQSQADGGCQGSDVNAVPCVAGVCPVLNELDNSAFACSAGDPSTCFCTLTPDLDYVVINSIKNPACDGGSNSGFFCESDTDCPGGTCNLFAHGGNCFDNGDKIQARVHIGAAGAPINGGEFLLVYDASCVSLNSVTALAPYDNVIYGPVYGTGSVFIAVGVDPFGGVDGPLGNVDVLALSFTKLGNCDECELCFGDNNPMHTYLTDNTGQRIDVAPNCKAVRERPDLVLEVPGSIKTNVDCNSVTAVESWDAPSASSSCGPATLTCRGAYEDGTVVYTTNDILNGRDFPIGSSSFCCVATEDVCDQAVGCAGEVNDCPIDSGTGKPAGCWTVEVNDETSLDIDVQLAPPITHNDANGELTRCIKFQLYDDCAQEPLTFSTDVTFGGLFNFSGKVGDKIKIPSSGQWDCITAQDQLHTLRSCYTLTNDDCVDGQLSASFEGDPILGGNWLIGGNLDGWKKNDGDPSSNPSLDVIDILDFGTFVGQSGVAYADNDTPCGTAGPNADINGDGVADGADYAFIIRNFLVSQKDCCCGPQIGSEPNPISSISVDQLREQGLGDLAVADLNGDGMLDTADMDAYSQGARPSKNNNRGGKGVRSGR
jgi:hypothetical protein